MRELCGDKDGVEVSKVRDQAETTSRKSCETEDLMSSYCMLCYAKQREIKF